MEQGTHEELLNNKGQYYRLWQMQQGNFNIDNKNAVEKEKQHDVHIAVNKSEVTLNDVDELCYT